MYIVLLTILGSSVCGELNETFYQDFRSTLTHPSAVMGIAKGQGEHQIIRREPQGLRIILSDKKSVSPLLGVSPRFHIRGDFEITMWYEILKLDKPATGYGVGVGLWVMADRDSVDAAFLSRSHRIKPGNLYVAGKGWWSPREEKYHTDQKTFPTESKSGKLRLSRVGEVVYYSVAEGTSDDFTEIAKMDYNKDDLSQVHLGVDTGGAVGSIDIRVIDFRIRAEELPLGASRKKTQRAWVLWLVSGLAGSGILVVGGVILWRKSLRRSS